MFSFFEIRLPISEVSRSKSTAKGHRIRLAIASALAAGPWHFRWHTSKKISTPRAAISTTSPAE